MDNRRRRQGYPPYPVALNNPAERYIPADVWAGVDKFGALFLNLLLFSKPLLFYCSGSDRSGLLKE
jgi:hypothetical protein